MEIASKLRSSRCKANHPQNAHIHDEEDDNGRPVAGGCSGGGGSLGDGCDAGSVRNSGGKEGDGSDRLRRLHHGPWQQQRPPHGGQGEPRTLRQGLRWPRGHRALLQWAHTHRLHRVQHTPEDLLTGVSFASGATGFDPLTPVIVGVISLEQQLASYDEYRSKLVGIAGEEETKRIIDGALFVVCAGTDDIANTYYTTPFRSAEYDIPSYVDLLLVGVESFLRNVSARGAKRIGFVGLPPIGCVPSQRTLGGGPRRSCVPDRNAAAQLYNTKVQDLIRELGKDKAGFPTLVYIDIYTVIQDLVEHGERYGFTETTRGCCSTGTVEVAVLCDARFAPVCDDVSQHVFFDSYHPTQRAYKVIVDYIFDHYIQFLHL